MKKLKAKVYTDGTGRGPVRMTVSDHNRTNWRRMAASLPVDSLFAFRLLGGADCDTLPCQTFYELNEAYCLWLASNIIPKE